MKKVLLATQLFFLINLNAQDFICGTLPEIIEQPSYDRFASSADEIKYVYNIYFWVINDSDGQNATNMTFGEPEVMECLYLLNKNFNTFNIFFKYRGMETVNNTEMSSNNINLNPPSKPGCINVRFKNWLGGATGLGTMGNTQFSLTFDAATSPHKARTLCHEMGHCFNLLHTNNFTTPCEHVTRNNWESNYNADTAGDAVEDTPAEGGLNPVFQNCTYQYNPLYVDCEGTPYEGILIGNYLSSASSDCGYHFTEGQILRMRAYAANPILNWPNVATSINSLYEPFEITDVPGDVVVSVEDNNDGTANVCRNIWRRNRFQRSFDYVFENTSGSDPVSATTFDLPVVQENTFEFQVRINQVDPAVAQNVEVICTRGVICNTEPFIGGRVISKEFLTSVNMDIRELTELEARDPNLFNELLAHYYHQITKYTSSGAQMQTLIYKQ